MCNIEGHCYLFSSIDLKKRDNDILFSEQGWHQILGVCLML